MSMQVRCAFDELVPISSLQLNPKNPNKHNAAQIQLLAKIMSHQGFRNPVVVSTQSGLVVKGHARIAASQTLGWPEVPVDYQEYDSPSDEYADLVADNEIARLAKTDLSQVLSDVLELGPDFDFDLLGILDFKLPEDFQAQCDEDALPESAPTRSNPGELWQLGRHRLLVGDATNESHVSTLLGDIKVDCVWTDPPYNVAYEGATTEKLTIKNDEMDDASFYKFLYDSFTNMFMFTKPGAAIYVAHADSEGANFRKALVESGFLLKQCLIWNKSSLVMGRQDYHWKHEPILYGWVPGERHNWFSDRKQTTVIDFDKPHRNGEHPTMKPVGLVEYFLENSCPKGGTVMDLFGGSGTTLIACEKTGRTAFTSELDAKYADVILARWEKFSGKQAQLIEAET